ncbi:DegT/DnrJ/EryC1/StrS family aminotransferase [Amylibacter sp.]|nr:DegT/DnrJ/EryC1/StrS family aminotransferase [Amylibacter sp.]
MSWKIQLSELNYDDKEIESVRNVIQDEWLTMGKLSNQFEKEFQNYIEHENKGVFVSSATAGLHLILMSLGIKSGDEVILPALTFVSDANVVLQLGATPIFCDSISLQNFNVCEQSIIDNITERTKAIIVVHFAGYPMDLCNLFKVTREKGIKLIEDCAHAPGASVDGVYCGNMADASFFSFFSNKNLAIGEGGMVFCKDNTLLDSVRSMRSHGISSTTFDRHEGRAFTYDVNYIGLNYRADEIRAALGIEQLKKLHEGNHSRQLLCERYNKNLSQGDIIVPFTNFAEKCISAYHIMPVILPENCDRTMIMNEMKNKGIQTSIHYPPFSSFSAYVDHLGALEVPVVDEICDRELTLPLHPRMSLRDVDYVTRNLMEQC